jgi:dipeptidyl aminopeptidase/acylaminoacyl peptidase
MMKKLALALFFIATTAFAQHPMTFEDLASLHRIGAPQLSPDGQWIAYDASMPELAKNYRHSAIFLVPAAGGESKKITDGVKQDEGPVWSSDGTTIAYVSNRDSSAKQVWLYDIAAGTSRKITDLPGGAGSVKWMPDGKGLVLVSDIYPECGVDPDCIKNRTTAEESKPTKGRVLTGLLYRHWTAWQEPTRSHILYVPIDGSRARDLTPGTFDAPPFSVGGGDEFDVSPDGGELVYARNTDEHPEVSTNADVFIYSFATSEAKRITSRKGADTSPKYSPDGKWISWRSQARAGYESDLWELWVMDRATGQTRRLAPEQNNWIEDVTWAPDSKSLFITAPEKSKTPIYEVPLNGAMTKVYGDGTAGAIAVSKDGRTLYFDRNTLSRPNDIYSLKKGSTTATQLTHDNDALLRNIAMGETSDVWYTGADGAQVQALLVKPPMFDASKKYPGIVLIHGGPQGAWGDAWSYRWNPQMFAARGYAVIAPNPRGSVGYGQKFVEEISGDWGGKAYIDIMNGVDKFAALPYVDANRLGAAGASYGGYMVDWILGHTDRFKVLVSHDGVYDLPAMYGTTEEVWFPEWEFKGNPWDNPELYTKWNPANFVKNFKTPTLVVHSELDYRVPVSQGFELFTALQRRGVPSKMLYFPDEGHWVLKPQNSKLWHETVLGWLDQWLK